MEQDKRESWLSRVAIGMAPCSRPWTLSCPLVLAWRSVSPVAVPRARRSASTRTIGALLCPVEDHGPMRHDPFDDSSDREMAKRLTIFTTKRLSGISRLAA